MTRALWLALVIAAVAVAVLAYMPSQLGPYPLGLMIGIMSYVVLATAWAMFSGPTRYISLATVAFFGLGAYTVAVLGDYLPYPLVLACAGLVGLVVALIVGVFTLRLAGVYFVVFTFGLTELIRQVVTWYEVNVTRTLGRYIFLDITTEQIYWQLLGLAVITIGIAFWVRRSRIGLALRVIGDDEVVAAHSGINIPATKIALFGVSSMIMALAGAIQSPRWTYIEPSIVFNPTISFLTVIMALLGGANRLWGPLLGAVPLFLLFEWLSAHFPNHYSIILGLLFIAIVFALPNGVLAFGEGLWQRLRRREAHS
ncbi:branched-chain amino acid ABC transporter permease [Cucumibacter marinus]|uniref:branched-chain amino acid ABC transporter permease n=1 Tax=Cucumibacter marinus TaxID=1121252 RepID=UPI000419C93B|nr:branched-chain amino acid ABC transporter permease [Cucumibacter marinus]